MKRLFEEFCRDYNLDYDFTLIGRYGDIDRPYKNYETEKAYLIFKYSANYRDQA